MYCTAGAVVRKNENFFSKRTREPYERVVVVFSLNFGIYDHHKT